MGICCVVYNCKHYFKKDKLSYYRIPAVLSHYQACYSKEAQKRYELSKKRHEAWIKAIRQGPLSGSRLKHARVCEVHFIGGKPAPLLDVNNPDWVPCQKLGYKVGSALKKPSSMARHNRYERRAETKEMKDLFEQYNKRISEKEELLEEAKHLIEANDEAANKPIKLSEKLRLIKQTLLVDPKADHQYAAARDAEKEIPDETSNSTKADSAAASKSIKLSDKLKLIQLKLSADTKADHQHRKLNLSQDVIRIVVLPRPKDGAVNETAAELSDTLSSNQQIAVLPRHENGAVNETVAELNDTLSSNQQNKMIQTDLSMDDIFRMQNQLKSLLKNKK